MIYLSYTLSYTLPDKISESYRRFLCFVSSVLLISFMRIFSKYKLNYTSSEPFSTIVQLIVHPGILQPQVKFIMYVPSPNNTIAKDQTPLAAIRYQKSFLVWKHGTIVIGPQISENQSEAEFIQLPLKEQTTARISIGSEGFHRMPTCFNFSYSMLSFLTIEQF